MKKIIVGLLLVLAVQGSFRCVGGFGLTKKVHGFVQGVGNKWASWIIFVVFAVFQVYTICLIVDAIVINSIEFWTGSNPLARADYDKNGEAVRIQTKGDERAVYNYRKYGEELVVRVHKNDKLVKSILLKKSEPGVLYSFDGEVAQRIDAFTQELGETVRVTILEGSKIISIRDMAKSEYAELNQKVRMVASQPALQQQF